MVDASNALSSATAALSRLWAAVHVKRRGQYPFRRLLALREYARETPCWRVLSVLVLTPLPSLLAISVLEVARLSPPSAGLAHQSVFLARESVSFCAIGFSLLQQASLQTGPSLPISTLRLAAVAMLTVVANVSFTYVLASRVGFPVPFSIQLCAPNHFVLETLALAFTWRGQLRADPDAIRHIARRGVFFMSQAFVITIYPVYYLAFTLVPDASAPRLAFLCLLPLIKLVNRQLFHHASRKSDGGVEFVPQVVVFNADVLGALFVAFCMQYKPSLPVAVGVAAVKVLTAAISFRDIRQAGRQLAALEAQIRACRQADAPPPSAGQAAEASVLDKVARIIALHATDDAVTPSALTPGKLTTSRVAAETPLGHGQPAKRSILQLCGLCAPRVAPLVNNVADLTDRKHMRVASRTKVADSSLATTVVALDAHRDAHRDELRRLEQLYVAFVTKLLYMAEFAILIEYVEIVVPALYLLYLVVMFHMPNRVYYAQFIDMDAANLTQTGANVVLYTAFELVSLVVVHAGLRRLLRVSPVRQLGFVLSRQAVHVQSGLLLWVVFSTQASLDHYGIDYSFQFAWLSNVSADATP